MRNSDLDEDADLDDHDRYWNLINLINLINVISCPNSDLDGLE
jgi:hypothetical protein